ncbi:L-threonylcarbamoyladenylate synthase [Aureibaculum sp. 2210JD6-5]|uniref:L-threonylcarbamoyladenylate synthase n=1 Tax=Aureibaculum sp. 2210JD6-5 TaxID=3103957 RepID=UPI002AADA9C0|nr:L-threonylcarbamoyladenylate synthase [Aureibaculum sp. 2210JD6-5]MDY7393693.1 L-threonylcarbamoyladenylate synthase [Aureibaculum sp. 2210JD6-5]
MIEEVKKSLEILQKCKTILYPTDTVWGLGCDATDEEAVSKIYTIKKREESKSLVILVDGLEMLENYVKNISAKVLEILKNSERPTTIIYNNPVGLAKNVTAKDNTVAIRVVKHRFCQNLIAAFGKPIVSTSANISGNTTPNSFIEIDNSILEGVDYVVNLDRDKIMNQPSRIIKVLEDKTLQIIRE